VAQKHSKFKPGQVIWAANVPDRNGVAKPDPRPLLIIRPEPLNLNSPLCCLGISTDPKTDRSDPAVEMPWDAETGSTTGLYKWCRVVLGWHVLIDQDQAEVSGTVSESFLADILDQRERAAGFRRS